MLVFAARSRQLVRWLWPEPEPEPEPERPGELVTAGGSDDYDRRAGDTILEPGDGDDRDWEMDEALELRRCGARCSWRCSARSP